MSRSQQIAEDHIMNTIFIQSQQICSHSEREDVALWGWWKSRFSFSVLGAFIKRSADQEADQFKLDVKAGDSVYVVSIIYCSGDSYGMAEGQGKVVWCFSTKAKAVALAEYVRKYHRDMQIFEFRNEHGNTVQQSNPAYDYFSNLDKCEVLALTVQ